MLKVINLDLILWLLISNALFNFMSRNVFSSKNESVMFEMGMEEAANTVPHPSLIPKA